MFWLDPHPANYIKSGPGQESVCDCPRPPPIEPRDSLVAVEFADETIAETRQALRGSRDFSPPVPGNLQLTVFSIWALPFLHERSDLSYSDLQ